MSTPDVGRSLAQPTAGGHGLLREEILLRGLDPDRPSTWAWDPWPDIGNAGAFAGRARGENCPCPFLAEGHAVRLLEGHALWRRGSETHHLLVLPATGHEDTRLLWSWYVEQAASGGSE